MIQSILIFIISILLEGIVSSIIKELILFFVIASIVTLSINFKRDEKKYYVICIIMGFIYDLIYTDTIFLHSFIFLLLAFFSFKLINKKNSFFKAFLTYIINIIIYILFMILFTISYKTYDVYKVINIFYDGLIINIIYFLDIYFINYVINCIFCNRLNKSSY